MKSPSLRKGNQPTSLRPPKFSPRQKLYLQPYLRLQIRSIVASASEKNNCVNNLAYDMVADYLHWAYFLHSTWDDEISQDVSIRSAEPGTVKVDTGFPEMKDTSAFLVAVFIKRYIDPSKPVLKSSLYHLPSHGPP